MIKNIIKRFSCWVKNLDKVRMRQRFAVVCILSSLFIVIISFLINHPSEKRSSEDETKAICTSYTKSNETFAATRAGISLDLISTQNTQEPTTTQESTTEEMDLPTTETVEETTEEEVEKRENILYYVKDEGYTFYLDAEYQDYLWKKLKECGHTELYELCIALMYHESRFETEVVSATNDHGLMQINNGNFSWLHDTLDIDSLDDPYDNIDCGVYILSNAYDKYNDYEASLVCYNQGYVGSVRSTKYSRCVIGDMEKLLILEEE